MPKRKRTQGQQAELSKDRCPNCGGPLKFPENWREGLCTSCGIFVEVVSATAESGPAKEAEGPDLKARIESAKFYLDSEDLLADAEPGETGSDAAAKTDTAQAEEPEATPQPAGTEAAATEAAPVKQAEPATKHPVSLTDEAEPASESPPERSMESAPPVPPPLEEVREAAPESEAPAPETAIPQPEEPEIAEAEPQVGEPVAPEAAAEAVVEPEWESAEEPEAIVEPTVEFEPAPAYEVVEPASVSSAAVSQAAVVSRASTKVPRLRDRVLLWVGAVLVAFGGSGLLLGSLLHDFFRVPLFGHAYDVFGRVNLSAVIFGSIFLAAGLAAIGLSLRGGVVKVWKAARA